MWEPGLALLRGMPAVQIDADSICYSAGALACEACSRWPLVLMVLLAMPKVSVQPEVTCYGSGLVVCDAQGVWDLSKSLVSELKRKKISAR